MGFIIDTKIKGLGLEERKESFYIYELENKKEHIFFYDEDGLVEISKEFLKKLLKYFNENPELLSNSSPPVRTSDRKSDFDKSKEFNTDYNRLPSEVSELNQLDEAI